MNKIDVKIVRETEESPSMKEKEIARLLNEDFYKLEPGLTGRLEIEIIFVDKDRIKALNKTHRKIDKPTDVLSFPQSQLESGKVNILGSIVICQKVISEKEEDVLDVIEHGLLHLLGFDHETDEKKWSKAAKKIGCRL